ncbi:MAG TPA: YihY/virulence factor BrkB family protein [Candidatus Anaerostipes excrementavium]|uniref:YihY/virulence factor BrkB family protein n=1 Tax=Candidatus Anaerostipes excrementavium TaxID=2838463 RepID=A0A9D2BAJ6_9FIRM|nr:YihY/virulence factor BrkB family protein [uncultured Anaerostipes sp.]HIX69071.1 YihY/virulence factor BrkB family protein [Candidatus Anaerostipes excrementavium]
MLKMISMIGSIIEKAQKDHITAFSAQAAFFTVLSFFPFLIVVLSLMRFFPITPQDMINLVETYLPEQYSGAVIPIIHSLNGKLTTTYMSLTILTLLWSASKGILSMMTGLNTIHEIEEKRNYFVLRFISSIYIGLVAVAVLLGMILLLFGNSLLMQLYRFQPVLENQHVVFAVIRFLIAFFVFMIVFIIMFRFLPSDNFKTKQVLPGALLASLGWIILSFLFSMYFDNFSIYNIMYGGLTSILLTLLWLYFCMMILFIGAEINQYFLSPKSKKKYLSKQ